MSAYGIMKKEVQLKKDMLELKYCPNCNEPNKPDARFCVKEGRGHSLSFEVVKEFRSESSKKRKRQRKRKPR